jgi:hypothetical protein
MPRRFPSSKNDLTTLEAQPLLTAGGLKSRNMSYTTPPLHPTNPHSGREDPFFALAGTKKWRVFAESWNTIVSNLRETDIISNDERDMLVFHFFQDKHFQPDPSSATSAASSNAMDEEFAKPVYLPVFQTAGCVERAMHVCEEMGTRFRALEDLPPQNQVGLTHRQTGGTHYWGA